MIALLMTAFTAPVIATEVPGETVELVLNIHKDAVVGLNVFTMDINSIQPSVFAYELQATQENQFACSATDVMSIIPENNEREAIGLCNDNWVINLTENTKINYPLKYPISNFMDTLTEL